MEERKLLNVTQSAMKRGTKLGCFLLIRAITGAVAIRFQSSILMLVYVLLTLCIPFIMWRIYQFFRYEEIEGEVLDLKNTFVYYTLMSFFAVAFSLFFLFIYLSVIDQGGVIAGFIELLTSAREEFAAISGETSPVGVFNFSQMIDTAIMEYQKMKSSDLVLNLLPGQIFWGVATSFLLALISQINKQEN
ncbi:MAG: DUF4199 family protein [Bacteroidaceae bacterium]|nr:DUF4199 family protein [Bacteroidaceae bacterium]